VNNFESRDYLKDILESFNDVSCFVENMSFDTFCQDKKTIYAVIRCIEVIGEASKKVPRALREKYPAIPWIQMTGMMDKMIHGYYEVDNSILWQTVKEDIPSLKLFVQSLSE
jgi:uncharacterized protein with HEPN domain